MSDNQLLNSDALSVEVGRSITSPDNSIIQNNPYHFTISVILDQNTKYLLDLQLIENKLIFNLKETLPKGYIPFDYRGEFDKEEIAEKEYSVNGFRDMEEVFRIFRNLIRNDLLKLGISEDKETLSLKFEIRVWCESRSFTLELKRYISPDEDQKKKDIIKLFKLQKKLKKEYKDLYKKHKKEQKNNINSHKTAVKPNEFDFEYIKSYNNRFLSGDPKPIYIKIKNTGRQPWTPENNVKLVCANKQSTPFNDYKFKQTVEPGEEKFCEIDAKDLVTLYSGEKKIFVNLVVDGKVIKEPFEAAFQVYYDEDTYRRVKSLREMNPDGTKNVSDEQLKNYLIKHKNDSSLLNSLSK